jgi:hypothetical protein
MINFQWGNHDWEFLIGQGNYNRVGHGRFMAFLFPMIFTFSNYLPFISYFWLHIGVALTVIMLLIYWRAPKSILIFIMIGLLFVLNPYRIVWFFFVMGETCVSWLPVCVLLGLILSENAAKTANKIKTITLNSASIILFFIALSSYPVVINIFCAVVIGRFIIDLHSIDINKENAIKIFNQFKYQILNFFISGLLFLSVILILKYKQIIKPMQHTTALLPLNDILPRIFALMRDIFSSLSSAHFVFIPKYYTWIFLIVIITALMVSLIYMISKTESAKGKIVKIFIWTASLFFLLFLSQFSNIITRDYMWTTRVLYYSFPYMQVLMLILIFKFNNAVFVKNITILLCFALIYISVLQDFEAQKVWKLGFESEKMMWNRAIYTIESNPNYVKDKKYNIFQVGLFPSMRSKYYKNKHGEDLYLLNSPYDANWLPGRIIQFYSNIKIDKRFSELDDKTIDKFKDELKKAKVFPAKQSVMIKENDIVIILDGRALSNIKKNI